MAARAEEDESLPLRVRDKKATQHSSAIGTTHVILGLGIQRRLEAVVVVHPHPYAALVAAGAAYKPLRIVIKPAHEAQVNFLLLSPPVFIGIIITVLILLSLDRSRE